MFSVERAGPQSEVTDASVSASARFLSASAFAVIVLAVGVPVWLLTTNVHRAHVPYSDIDQLGHLRLQQLPLPVLLVTPPNEPLADLHCVSQLSRRQLSDEEELLVQEGGVAALDEWLTSRSVVEGSQSVAASSGSNINRSSTMIRVYVLPYTVNSTVIRSGSLVLGERAVFMTPTMARNSLCNILEEASSLIPPSTQPHSNQTNLASGALPVAASYDVVLTVAVGRPDPNKPVLPELTDRIVGELEPLLRSLHVLARFTVKSQYLFHVNLGVKMSHDPATGYNYIYHDLLPLVITPLERRLGSVVSTASTLHFVVFVPASSDRPLFVGGGDGSGATSAFVAARWGGVFIANEPEANLSQIGAVFAAQLRQLIGANLLADELTVDRTVVALTDLEMALLRRRRIGECFQRASANLAALASMLAQISNIVISDQVSDTVCAGVEHFHAAVRLWRSGDEISAHERALAVLNASETAVFHPSMLALLYFPHDQKYAIYIPLFLPVCIPVLGSIRSILVFLRGRRAVMAAKKNV